MHAHLRSRGRRWSVAKTSHRVSSADGMSKRILRLIIAQSGFYSAALQLGNVSIVLPFVVAELDAELWIAALIFPAFTAGGAIGNVVAPPAVAAVPRRHRLFIIVSCLAVLAGVNALCATIGKGSVAGILLVVNVTLIGVVSAISFVAFADLVAAMPSGTARARILLTEVGVGAALTAVVAATLSFVPDQHPLSRNIHLLWTAAVAMAISAAICRALPHRIVPQGPCGARSAQTRVRRLDGYPNQWLVSSVPACAGTLWLGRARVLVPQHSRRRRTRGPARRGRCRRPFRLRRTLGWDRVVEPRPGEIWPGRFVCRQCTR